MHLYTSRERQNKCTVVDCYWTSSLLKTKKPLLYFIAPCVDWDSVYTSKEREREREKECAVVNWLLVDFLPFKNKKTYSLL